MTPSDKRTETVKQILQAALTVFAEKGYAGATTEAIARRAGVNKAMLYYYVGSKEELFGAAILHLLVPARNTLAAALDQTPHPEEKLPLIQATFAALFRQHPQLPRLMLRTLTTELQRIPQEVLAAMAQVYSLTAAVVGQGVGQGVFRPVNPALAHLLVIGSLALACEAGEVLRRLAEAQVEPLPPLPPWTKWPYW
ncbi:MAG: TetR/AcrR family transcriptional regulator [Thermoanaerobaculum sp.]|nr:TetR/AcrR family transcriptional regulator [Thermoanaerobaculum sp.]